MKVPFNFYQYLLKQTKKSKLNKIFEIKDQFQLLK